MTTPEEQVRENMRMRMVGCVASMASELTSGQYEEFHRIAQNLENLLDGLVARNATEMCVEIEEDIGGLSDAELRHVLNMLGIGFSKAAAGYSVVKDRMRGVK